MSFVLGILLLALMVGALAFADLERTSPADARLKSLGRFSDAHRRFPRRCTEEHAGPQETFCYGCAREAETRCEVLDAFGAMHPGDQAQFRHFMDQHFEGSLPIGAGPYR